MELGHSPNLFYFSWAMELFGRLFFWYVYSGFGINPSLVDIKQFAENQLFWIQGDRKKKRNKLV